MAYASIIAKHSESFIKSIREEIFHKVSEELCAKNKIENPYLTRDEMDALATNNGTAKPLKFGDCPDNIFTSPTSPLTFNGLLIRNDFYKSCNLKDLHPLIPHIKKHYGEWNLISYHQNNRDGMYYDHITKDKKKLDEYREIYYIDNERSCFVAAEDYQNYMYFYYPKNSSRVLSRYFLEYEKKFPFDYIIAPILVHYDFFLQERLGFLNRKSTEMRLSTLYKKTVMHDKAVEKFEKRVEAKELELKEKEQSIDKMIESARQFEEETKKRLDERERMIDMESDLLSRMMIKNKQIEQKYETSRSLVNIKEDLVSICEELLIFIKTDEKSRDLIEIKKKLMCVYANAVDVNTDIAIATPIDQE
jgi:hypothetical protein